MSRRVPWVLSGKRDVLEYLADHAVDAVTPFQTAGWWRAWIRTAATKEGAVPVLAAAQLPGGRTVLAGLQQHRLYGGRIVLMPLSWPWADYHEAVTIADSPATAGQPGIPTDAGTTRILAGALDQARRQFRARLDLPDLVNGGLLHRAAVHLGAQISPSSTVVRVDLTSPENVRRMTGRGEIRRKTRRLELLGTLRLTNAETPVRLAERLPAFIALHAAQWRDRPDAVAPFDGGVVDRTFAAVTAEGGTGARLSELWLDRELLAAYFGFVHCGSYWAYRTAFDARHRRMSPGHQLVAALVAQLIRERVRTFDLMRGSYVYKLEYPSAVSRNTHAELGWP